MSQNSITMLDAEAQQQRYMDILIAGAGANVKDDAEAMQARQSQIDKENKQAKQKEEYRKKFWTQKWPWAFIVFLILFTVSAILLSINLLVETSAISTINFLPFVMPFLAVAAIFFLYQFADGVWDQITRSDIAGWSKLLNCVGFFVLWVVPAATITVSMYLLLAVHTTAALTATSLSDSLAVVATSAAFLGSAFPVFAIAVFSMVLLILVSYLIWKSYNYNPQSSFVPHVVESNFEKKPSSDDKVIAGALAANGLQNDQQDIQSVATTASFVGRGLQDDFPLYASRLSRIVNISDTLQEQYFTVDGSSSVVTDKDSQGEAQSSSSSPAVTVNLGSAAH